MRLWLRIVVVGLLVLCLGKSHFASAQDPDIRNIRPHVILLVDTSGSMERKPDCICTTPACLECLPVCSAGAYEQNRWSVVAQALTGEFTPYECNPDVRIGGIYAGQYDEGYFLPHIQLPQEIPTYTGSQSGNGVLDIYLERIKFGLMTFDSVGTLSDQPPLVPQSVFETAAFQADSFGTKGMYSYASDRPFSFPSATTTYMINSGARSELAPEGGLVTVGADDTGAMTTTNQEIQATILGDTLSGKNPLRPYGATPTAALVEDLRNFLQTDVNIIEKTADPGPGDPYYNCRPRSAVLLTDGFPNGDMRGPPVNCQDTGNPVGPTGCPYEETTETVSQMISTGELDRFHVIGFALDGDAAQVAAVEALLNDVASVGNTDEAYFVSTREELVSALSQILNIENSGTTSRTAPVLTGLTPGLVQAQFVSGFNVSLDSNDPWDGVLERRRIECVGGLPVAQDVEDSDRFQLVLNAQVVPPTNVEPWSSDISVSFTGGFSRNLWTILPIDPADINGHLIGNGKAKLEPGIDVPDDFTNDEIRDVPPGEFSRAVSPEYFFGTGSTDTALRDTVVEWVHAIPGSGRENERLGDIYHSTPAIVGPLVDDLEDRSYNDWRLGLGFQESPDSTEILTGADSWQLNSRPRVIYASSNDGVIHAFLADDYGDVFTGDLDEFACAGNKAAGTELWGFIPPMFLDDLDDLLSGGSKQWYADGNIVVRNLYDARVFAADADSPTSLTNVWRTVLFLSFRNGANGMVALDVTNPCKPEFLWQFTDDDLGDTYGQPTAAQIFVQDSNPTPKNNPAGPIVFDPRQSRAMILLPGGQGVEDTSANPCTFVSGSALPEGMVDWDDTTITPRADRRCWRGSSSVPPEVPKGRALYFIDMITGTVIRKLDENTFPAPLNGAVSVFRGDTATVGSAAYTVDADGVLWRIDMSSLDPDDWDAEALHDLYYDQPFDIAEPTYYSPVLTVDPSGRVVILTGTGNVDLLDDATAKNRVVSITEKLTFDANGFVDTLEGRLNWQVDLQDGEQMTGPIELFGGSVFFASFKAQSGTAIDACPLGGSRVWGLEYLDNPLSPGDFIPLFEDSGGSPSEVIDETEIPSLENALLIGLQVGQLPVCTVTQDVSVTDPFDGTTSTLAMPVATSGRQFQLLGHLSGSQGSTGGLSIELLEEAIATPESMTVITGMSETME